MDRKGLLDEVAQVLMSGQVKWLVIQPIVYLVYGPLWILGLVNNKLFQDEDLVWWFLFNIIYLGFLYIFYSFYIVYYYWETKMNDLFWRTYLIIMFGIIIWIFLTFNSYLI